MRTIGSDRALNKENEILQKKGTPVASSSVSVSECPLEQAARERYPKTFFAIDSHSSICGSIGYEEDRTITDPNLFGDVAIS